MNILTNWKYVISLFSSNYVPSDYKCTNTDVSDWLVRDSNKSFPSGHASLSAYTAVFMMVSCSFSLRFQ
jgi:membrane-associated phospholipid phosphatase